MYKKIKIHKTKRNIMTILIVILLLAGCLFWYREQGTNREIPKRARLVNNLYIEGDYHR